MPARPCGGGRRMSSDGLSDFNYIPSNDLPYSDLETNIEINFKRMFSIKTINSMDVIFTRKWIPLCYFLFNEKIRNMNILKRSEMKIAFERAKTMSMYMHPLINIKELSSSSKKYNKYLYSLTPYGRNISKMIWKVLCYLSKEDSNFDLEEYCKKLKEMYDIEIKDDNYVDEDEKIIKDMEEKIRLQKDAIQKIKKERLELNPLIGETLDSSSSDSQSSSEDS